jgi:hypothetical protein
MLFQTPEFRDRQCERHTMVLGMRVATLKESAAGLTLLPAVAVGERRPALPER